MSTAMRDADLGAHLHASARSATLSGTASRSIEGVPPVMHAIVSKVRPKHIAITALGSNPARAHGWPCTARTSPSMFTI